MVAYLMGFEYHQKHDESGNKLCVEKSVGAAASINIENIKVKIVHKRN
jgi:hypothetical protein